MILGRYFCCFVFRFSLLLSKTREHFYFRCVVEGTLNIYSLFEVTFSSCAISEFLRVGPLYTPKIGLISKMLKVSLFYKYLKIIEKCFSIDLTRVISR